MKARVPPTPPPDLVADAHRSEFEWGSHVAWAVRTCYSTLRLGASWTGMVPLPFSASGQLPFCTFLCCWGTAQLGPCLLPSHLSGRRDWGIENFISPTLLRNMRGKDIKKAISYHMKRNQVLLDPRQKVVCVPWFKACPGWWQHLSGQRGNVFPPWVSSLWDHLGLFSYLFLL